MADRDDDDRRLALGPVDRARLDERPQQRERLEVDPGELDPGLLRGGDIRDDLLARRDDQQHAADGLAALPGTLAEHAVVEHRLVRQDRQHLVRLEADGVVEAVVGDA